MRFGDVVAGLSGLTFGEEFGPGLHIVPHVWNPGWSNSPTVDPTVVRDVTAILLHVVLVDHTLVRGSGLVMEFNTLTPIGEICRTFCFHEVLLTN